MFRSAVAGLSKATPAIAKWTKHTLARHLMVGGLGATVVGTPVQVADEFERWVEEGDVDGFNIVSNNILQLSRPRGTYQWTRRMLSLQALSTT